MTADERNERAERESGALTRHNFSINWINVPTIFGHSLLVATLRYRFDDANKAKPALVLGKVFAECVEDMLSRFVFWLTADLNIEHANLDKETRDAVRGELSKTVKPLTAQQTAQMNARVNSLPDYLRAFYLEDYFESLQQKHN